MLLQRWRADFVREHPELRKAQPPLLIIEIIVQPRRVQEGLVNLEDLHFIFRQRYSLVNTFPQTLFERALEEG